MTVSISVRTLTATVTDLDGRERVYDLSVTAPYGDVYAWQTTPGADEPEWHLLITAPDGTCAPADDDEAIARACKPYMWRLWSETRHRG